MTHSTTDLSLHPVFFETPSVEGFISNIMKTDTQSLVVRMEGFALQDIGGIIYFV